MKKKVGIFYIATGLYPVFWLDFFSSSEAKFLPFGEYEKHYFLFSDVDNLEHENNPRVHKFYQEALPWPFITLDRFAIFKKAYEIASEMDYLYFFNANALFVAEVDCQILPCQDQPLVFVKHPGFYNKNRSEFTYESNPRSSAAMSPAEGKFYFMGGVNGGVTSAYLEMISWLDAQIQKDKIKGITSVWHDESHLNRYAVDNEFHIKVLDPDYGYPEGWYLPFEPKVIIRDKRKYGGHKFLRQENIPFFGKVMSFFKQV